MLDAYIIQKIRNEKEKEVESSGAPLRIDVPFDRSQSNDDLDQDEGDAEDRGVVIIDFTM